MRKGIIIVGYLLICCCITLSACTSNKQKGQDQQQKTSQKMSQQDSLELTIDEDLAIPMPKVPKNISDPREKANYIINHFWDQLNFNDTTYLKTPDKMEASFANFIALALCFPVEDEIPALLLPLENSNDKMLHFFLEMYKKYLYDPNSPMRNESFYIPIAEWASKSAKVDYAMQERMKSIANLAKKNQVGDKAINFAFQRTDGALTTLYAVKGMYTILMFYTPGCHTCEMTIDQIKRLPALKALDKNQKVRLVCIYAEPDIETWEKYESNIPEYAVNGIDKDGTILSDELYDLKASPTLYLLDKDKKVILKDAGLQEILPYLEEKLEVRIK
ncbi:DUF5106 domain-containing protein [Falsiporphyromonas endometrii]|uniref:DUF5106 domain-containing protein n=1 Tax=Falsiporphyromonas endometrii TaxID=1387297 RepID=A0ABV9K731_9PORP